MSRGMEFEWDAAKERANRSKHGIGFLEAISVFGDEREFVIHDAGHSADEDRFLSVGVSVRARVLVVCYTERGGVTRIISARRATKHEQQTYSTA